MACTRTSLVVASTEEINDEAYARGVGKKTKDCFPLIVFPQKKGTKVTPRANTNCPLTKRGVSKKSLQEDFGRSLHVSDCTVLGTETPKRGFHFPSQTDTTCTIVTVYSDTCDEMQKRLLQHGDHNTSSLSALVVMDIVQFPTSLRYNDIERNRNEASRSLRKM